MKSIVIGLPDPAEQRSHGIGAQILQSSNVEYEHHIISTRFERYAPGSFRNSAKRPSPRTRARLSSPADDTSQFAVDVGSVDEGDPLRRDEACVRKKERSSLKLAAFGSCPACTSSPKRVDGPASDAER